MSITGSIAVIYHHCSYLCLSGKEMAAISISSLICASLFYIISFCRAVYRYNWNERDNSTLLVYARTTLITLATAEAIAAIVFCVYHLVLNLL